MSVEFWAEFFQAAGLEPAVAASYANIFFVNKIQPTHLPDIDRDALKEMNITPMGDILTILKFIKTSHTVVTPLSTISPKEQPLLYQDDVLKSSVQFRNIQDSKSGFCAQKQFGCGAQHTITIAEEPFQSRLSPSACQMRLLPSATSTHSMQSADIPVRCNLSPTFVHESPLNLTVHENSSTNKNFVNESFKSQYLEMQDCETSNDLCNSINATVSYDPSRTKRQIYRTSLGEVEMDTNTNGFKTNPGTSVILSDVYSCDSQESLSFSPPVVSNTVLQCKKPVLRNCAIFTKETLPRSPLVEGSNEERSQNCALETALIKSAVNQRFSKERIISPGEATPHQKRSVFDRIGQQSNMQEIWDKSDCQPFTQTQQYRNELRQKSTSQRDNRPDASSVAHRTTPRFSGSPQNEDPELESLRDPTITQHKEQFYLAWSDRRKRVHPFPALKPSFLQVS